MISDVLTDAVLGLDRYLDDPGAWGAVATRTITTEVVENDDSE